MHNKVKRNLFEMRITFIHDENSATFHIQI